MGRRAQKVVSNWGATNWVGVSTNQFIYDLGGWNLLAIVTTDHRPLTTFLWGQDLSGTMDQAGGIGGLLAVCEYGSGQMTNADFAAYDGNGNITALVRASDGNVSARYEYSAFGQTLRSTGPMAKANPFRFSTKFADDESGFVYYGYRYYNPSTGRWLSRDPLGEMGGAKASLNLYDFVGNDPIGYFDVLGL